MKFYKLKGKENIDVENGYRDYLIQCSEGNVYDGNIKNLITKKIYCKKCKRLLMEYKTPEDREDIIIDGYWYIYLAKDKKIYCKKCKKSYDTNKLEVNIFECPNCKKIIKDYRGKEFLCTQGLLSYHVREDGHLGLECSCGADTRPVACTDSKKADFKNEKCLFKIESED